jgi:transposase
MRIDYAARIVEGAADLLSRERAARGRAMADRLKFLRLLKGGEVGSVSAAARLLGYSVRQGQRWWRLYARGGGLAGLLATGRRGGSRERMTDAAWAGLDRELRAGRVARLKDAQAYLRERHGIAYSLDGLSGLFRRHKVKRKTGRPWHRWAAAADQAAFKRSARGDAAGAPDRAPVVPG